MAERMIKANDEAQLDEQLVAYLDGELSDEEVRRVEALLASDPEVRQRLARLERTWALLDRLDRVPTDEQFTRSTLEMVAVSAKHDLDREQAERPRRRRRRWLMAGAGLLGAALAGFLAVAALWPDPDRQLLEDLSVLEDLDQLRHVEDVEFLRMLYRADLFTKDPADPLRDSEDET